MSTSYEKEIEIEQITKVPERHIITLEDQNDRITNARTTWYEETSFAYKIFSALYWLFEPLEDVDLSAQERWQKEHNYDVELHASLTRNHYANLMQQTQRWAENPEQYKQKYLNTRYGDLYYENSDE